MPLDMEDLITVRCRECRKWLCRKPKGQAWKLSDLPSPLVAGRIDGFSYCAECFESKRPAQWKLANGRRQSVTRAADGE